MTRVALRSLVGIVCMAVPALFLHACDGDILEPVVKRDASPRTSDGGCDSRPTIVCANKDVAACYGQAAEDPILARLPQTTGVALGCSVEFPSPTPLPRTLECYMEARCTCLDKGFGPRWDCHR